MLYDINEDTQIDEFGVDQSNFSLRDKIKYNFMRAKEKERNQSLIPDRYQNDYSLGIPTRRKVEEHYNTTPLQPDFRKHGSLLFDGSAVSWLEDGEVKKSYPAMSGQKDYQSRDDTCIPNMGPIPEGRYVLERGSGQDYNSYKEMSLLSRMNPWRKKRWYEKPSAWGNSRIPIKPLPETNTFGRHSMYVHGGDVPGSAGCIDLTHYNDDFYDDFKNYDDDMILKVKYPKDW